MDMTLAMWRTQFWSAVTMTLKANPKEIEQLFPPDDATAKLNIGWNKAVESIGGFGGLITTNIVADQEEYTLPDNTIRPIKVQIVDSSGNIVARPRKCDYKWLAKKTNKPIASSHTPDYWAWDHRSTSTTDFTKKIRIYPAYPENVTNGLYIETKRGLDFVADSDGYPQLTDSLAEAGLHYACYLATRYQGFLLDYKDSVSSYLRSTKINSGTGFKVEPAYSDRG